MRKKIFGFIVFFFACCLIASGNDLPIFSKLSLEQGLQGASVRCSFQDSFGYLWLGIDSKGLCRYDGNKLHLYSSSEDTTSISNNFVTSILEDKHGNLWIGTEYGLNRYSRTHNTFKRFYASETERNSLFDNKINTLFNDSKGIIWIGTDKGLNKLVIGTKDSLEITQVRLQSVNSSLLKKKDLAVNAIYEDSLKQHWFGTKYGLFKYDAGLNKIEYWPTEVKKVNGLNCKRIYCITQINSDYYLGTNNGIFEIINRGKKLEFKQLNVVSANSNIKNITYFDNKIWVATANEGVFWGTKAQLYEGSKGDLFHRLPSISCNQIEDINLSKSGLMCVATQCDGLYYTHAQNQIQYILKDTSCTAYWMDDLKNEWIGTYANGLFCKKFNSKTAKLTIPYSKTKQINCIVTSGNLLYIGNNNGLIVKELNSDLYTKFSFHKIQAILKDKDNLWVGSKNGVYTFDVQTNKFSNPFAGLMSDFSDLETIITSLARSKNSLWIGTDSRGLFEFNFSNKHLTHYVYSKDNKNSLSSNYIRSLYVDAKENVWIGTKYGGLNCFQPSTKQFKSFRDINGLSNNAIYAILEDSKNFIWIGTHNGIVRLDPETHSIENFNGTIGLNQNCIINPNAAFLGTTQYPVFGSNTGLVQVFTDKLNLATKGSFMISSIKSNGNLKLNCVTQDTMIQLHHSERYIEIELAFIDFFKSSKANLYYKLDGRDDTWMPVENENIVTFSDLKPDEYTFRFGIKNLKGEIEEASFNVKLEINPSIWQSKLAYLIYAFMLAVLVFFVFRYWQTKSKMQTIIKQMEQFQAVYANKNELYESINDSAHSLYNWTNGVEVNARLSKEMISEIKNTIEQILQKLPASKKTTPLPLATDTVNLRDTNQAFLQKCYEILDENYKDVNFNVTTFSQEIGLSRTNFYNKLKDISGFTPSNLIWEYRLLKASSLLKDKSLTISELAYKCGFENMSSFSTMYKKRFGHSPSNSRSE